MVFTRAERAVYQEAKRLVALGWARAKNTATGPRISTVYRITPVGREALRGWLAEPSEPTHIESEAALKVFFADQAGTCRIAGDDHRHPS
jgi:DNA-binding PadR family transcriptional regulator